MAYGYLKGETGIHRLVRISPFNSEGKRQTSFAAVDVSPEVSDDLDIEIDEKDVREDTYRSGAGGQHVNKTDSAVRLTHEPTGIVVQCQNEREVNTKTEPLLIRCYGPVWHGSKRKNGKPNRHRNTKTRLEWDLALKFRNYFLHPDQRVKDARTGHSEGNFHSVLDGNIQRFLESFLRWRIGQD